MGYAPNYLEGISPSEYIQRMDDESSAEKAAAVVPAAVPVSSGTAQVTAVQASNASAGQRIALADASTVPAPAAAGGGGSDQSLQHQADVDRLRQQQQIYKAQGLVELAKKSEASGNDQEALNDYTQAVDLDPSNTAAVQGRDRLNSICRITCPARCCRHTSPTLRNASSIRRRCRP